MAGIIVDREYFEKEQLQAFSSYKIENFFNKCLILNRHLMFTSRLRYRLFGVLSDIRWVVNNVLVSRRMDTHNKCKARLSPESLRYD